LDIVAPSFGAATYAIRVYASCIQTPGTIVAYWNISEGFSITNADWIGIYKAGRCGKTVGSSCPLHSDAWSYVNSNGTSGTQIISAPTTTGTYLAYYLYDSSHKIKAISASFSISSSCTTINLTVYPQTVVSNQTVVVSWNGANTSDVDDWIGFWQIDSSPSTDHNRIPNAWSYTYGGINATSTHPTASGNVSLRVPALYGTYTIYYCQNNGYTCLGSTTVKVINPNICKSSASTTSTVTHIIIIVPENHSFDSIYGRYCEAATGSKPTCNFGPSCCEAAPNSVSGSSPITLTDHQNMIYDPDHSAVCETCEVNNGAMDRFVTGCPCSSPSNFAIADNTSAKNYYLWASSYAIADNFFQSAIGASSENDMYFATGKFLFLDNDAVPQNSHLNGARCYTHGFRSYSSTTIADLLNYCGIDWTFYAEGYDKNPKSNQCYPNYYDASDDPFTYFPSLINSSEIWSRNFRDYNSLYTDITNRTLPAVSYVKGLGIHSEHPGISTITAGEIISQNIIDAITASNTYRTNTVIFIYPDESGGYYDHVSPPMRSTIDNQLYGPRIPLIAVGDQIKRNYVSHVQMEFSSLIRFIEWNWLNGEPGQLGTRDTVANNIGDLFDNQKTGVNIPS
jgi:phospholipase C